MSKYPIVWANDAQGIAKHILEVPSGLECGCACPGCGAKLEAVNSRNPAWKLRPHFRHYELPELENCAQSSVLEATKQVLARVKEIRLPSVSVEETVSIGKQNITARIEEQSQIVSVEATEFVDATSAILTLPGMRCPRF